MQFIFRTLKSAHEHFDEYVYHKGPKQFTDEENERLEHGRNNEIHAFGVIASTFMPALLPTCATLYEEGPTIMSGENRDSLICISPDGFIKHEHEVNTCVAEEHENRTLELKCPFPNSFALPIHYEIPACYSTQCLLQMKAKKVKKHWYASKSKTSTCLIELDIDSDLMRRLVRLIRKNFDVERPIKPTKVTDEIKEFKLELKQFCEIYSTLIGEVPSINADEGQLELLEEFYPYHIPRPVTPMTIYSDVDEDLLEQIIKTSQDVFTESHQHQRREATEILAFLLTDAHRNQRSHIPSHLPIAYGLKGASLNVVTMRNLIDDVRNRCLEENIGVICEVYDGAWYNIIVRSANMKPLTQLQFMKDTWKKWSSWSKLKLLNYLSWFTKVSLDDIDQLDQFDVLGCDTTFTKGNIAVTNNIY